MPLTEPWSKKHKQVTRAGSGGSRRGWAAAATASGLAEPSNSAAAKSLEATILDLAHGDVADAAVQLRHVLHDGHTTVIWSASVERRALTACHSTPAAHHSSD